VPPLTTLPLFAAAALGLLLIPGPAVLYITARSAAQGWRAGVVSVLGIHTGTLVHVMAAVVGLSALIAASAVAFSAIKLLGAMYLIYLGVRTIASRRPVERKAVEHRGLRRLYVDGVIVNILNPKTALFFLAFLPQFVDPDRGGVWLQTLILGAVFIGIGLLTDGTYALAGAQIGRFARARRPAERRTGKVIEGGILIGLGVAALAVPDRRPAS
jgi:threonine/homoserine/homoserine lactone efflux protein